MADPDITLTYILVGVYARCCKGKVTIIFGPGWGLCANIVGIRKLTLKDYEENKKIFFPDPPAPKDI